MVRTKDKSLAAEWKEDTHIDIDRTWVTPTLQATTCLIQCTVFHIYIFAAAAFNSRLNRQTYIIQYAHKETDREEGREWKNAVQEKITPWSKRPPSVGTFDSKTALTFWHEFVVFSNYLYTLCSSRRKHTVQSSVRIRFADDRRVYITHTHNDTHVLGRIRTNQRVKMKLKKKHEHEERELKETKSSK